MNRRISLSAVLVLVAAMALGSAHCASSNVKSAAESILVALDVARTDAVNVAAQKYVNLTRDPACDPACKGAAAVQILRVNDLSVKFSEKSALASGVLSSWSSAGDSASRLRILLEAAQQLLSQMESISGTSHAVTTAKLPQ